MRPIATDRVAWSVGLSVCHDREPCKNRYTDRDAVWGVDSGGPKEAYIRRGCTLAPPCEYGWTVHVRWRCGLFVKFLRPLCLVSRKTPMLARCMRWSNVCLSVHYKPAFCLNGWTDQADIPQRGLARRILHCAVKTVYTIQPIVKPVVKPVRQSVVSCIQTFNRFSNPFDNRFDNRLYRVHSRLSNRFVKPVWQRALSCIQPVERTAAVRSTRNSGSSFNTVVKPVDKPVWQPVWQPAVSCKRGLIVSVKQTERLVNSLLHYISYKKLQELIRRWDSELELLRSTPGRYPNSLK